MLPSGLSFRDPGETLADAEAAMEGIPNDQLFSQPKHRPLLEQWAAGWFGVAYRHLVADCQVAINPKVDDEADFFLRRDAAGPVFSFQNVEVMEPERRRSAEYKNPGLRPYRPGRGTAEGPSWLEVAVRDKLDKRYAGARQLHLLVYVNFDAQGIEFSAVAQALEPFRGEFASVWVMAHHVLGSVFSTPHLGETGGWRLHPRVASLVSAS